MTIPAELEPYFRAAGWFPGRAVPLPEPMERAVPQEHPARAIVSAFGGLRVGACGEGEECARDDVAFEYLAPDDSEDDPIRQWSSLLGTHLVGIGLVHRAHGALYVDLEERLFGLSFIHDAFWLYGESFTEAMRRSLFGRRVRPLIAPHQDSVTVYGRQYRRGDAEVYRAF